MHWEFIFITGRSITSNAISEWVSNLKRNHDSKLNVPLALTLNIPSLARQRCLPSRGPPRTPWFFVISQLFDAVDYSNYFWGGLWNYNSVIQELLVSNIYVYLFQEKLANNITRGVLRGPPPLYILRINIETFWILNKKCIPVSYDSNNKEQLFTYA